MTGCRDSVFDDTLVPYRKKFICLNCEIVWKAKYTKRQEHEKWKRDQKTGGTNYFGSNCRKCGQDAIEVGPTFVGSDWQRLREDYEKGVNFKEAFQFCPVTRSEATYPATDGRRRMEGVKCVVRHRENYTEEEQQRMDEHFGKI